jgi:hypothetical protein
MHGLVRSASRKTHGEQHLAGGAKLLARRTKGNGDDVRPVHANPPVRVLAQHLPSAGAEFAEAQVAAEEAGGGGGGVVGAEFREALIFTPLTFDGCKHEVDTVILSVADLNRGVDGWLAVSWVRWGGAGAVRGAPATNKHKIGPAWVIRQEIGGDSVVLSGGASADSDGVTVRQEGVDVGQLFNGGRRFAGVDQQGAAALLALLAKSICNEVDGGVVTQRRHKVEGARERNQRGVDMGGQRRG